MYVRLENNVKPKVKFDDELPKYLNSYEGRCPNKS